MGRKTYLKIVMPSAPTVSFAPYDSQTIGLTTWDEAATIDGVTYHPARFALGDGTSTGDFSKGKGGLALGNQIASLEVENIFSGGLLKNYVDAGTIPLVGAVVTILDGVGATPQTWVLQEPSGDGPVLSFKLCTPGYLNQKRLQFAAMRYDGAATVGLAVGDASVRGINASGRYKGVSVPTKAFADWEPLQYPGIAVSGKRGNPQSWGAEEYGNTTHPYDYVGPAPFGQFCFAFPSQALRDAFMNQYCGGLGGSQSGGHVAPNACLLVSDGSNSEIILTSDSTGASSGSATVLECSSRVIGGATYYTILLFVTQNGMLASSAASSIQLYFLQQDNPICAGASSVVGFQSKASTASEYGITSPSSIQALKNNILYLMPTQQATDGFMSWTELDNPRGFVINPSNYVEKVTSLDGSGDNSEFNFGSGKIENISTKSGEVPGTPFFIYIRTFQYSGGSERYLEIHIEHLLNNKSFNFDISKVFVDSKFSVSATGKATFSSTWKWIDPFCTSQQSETDSNASYSFDKELNGPGQLIAKYVYDSVEAVVSDNCSRIASFPSYANHNAAITQQIYQIVLYAITKLSFGSNPAVVVPGNFPGTSNPTTTPTLAAAQLAAWLGLSNISLTGGITPTAGTWGEYLGEDPSSTSSDDTTSAKDRLSSLLQEACIYGAETGGTVALPDVEVAEHPSTPSSSIDDVVTMPQFTYCYAGTSAQFTAKILNVDETFDISKGDGYYWSGWQEKDTCHLSASPGSAVLAMCQLEDCLAVVCADGKIRCSYDGGETWLQTITANAPTSAAMASGGGVMLATFSYAGATNEYLSADAGRTWTLAETMTGVLIFGAYYDSTTSRFWICGKDADGSAAVWYAVYGSAWTKIVVTGDALSARSILAVGDNVFITAQISGAWSVFRNTISGGGSIWPYQQLGSHTDWTDAPHLARWNGSVRIAIGVTLWSSADLLTWTNSATPIALSSFATDGKVVSALGSEASGGNHTYYSRDQGATWRAVRISPEGFTWVSIGALTAIWDDNAKCFRFSGWGSTRLIALGDPSVLDIWIQCREAYLATSTLATDTFDKRGLYDASELVRWLLDCKDGTDAEYQQPFIKWITRPARFVIVRGKYQSIVDQLSVAAGLPITIPRKMLTYSGYDQNLPTKGIISKATHTLSGTDAGLAEIEIIMPPL